MEEKPSPSRRAASSSRGATSHDVALLAGVSQPTVSRALRGDRRISEATRLRVLEAAREIDYVTDHAGRSLAQRATTIVGIASAHLRNPYYPELLDPLIEELEGAGYRTVLLSTRQSDQTLYEQLTDGSVDGAILTSSLFQSALPDLLTRRRLPYVLVNRNVPGADADRCLVDNYSGARNLARALLSLGHRSIALVLGGSDASTSIDREQGFRDELAAHGLAIDESLVRRGVFSTEYGQHALTDLVADGRHFSAVFCANDVLALGALNAAEQHGLRVPADLTVVGFDDIPIASWHRVQLTTVRQDTEEMGREGARMLIRRLADRDIARQSRLLPTSLVMRDTHGPPAPGS